MQRGDAPDAVWTTLYSEMSEGRNADEATEHWVADGAVVTGQTIPLEGSRVSGVATDLDDDGHDEGLLLVDHDRIELWGGAAPDLALQMTSYPSEGMYLFNRLGGMAGGRDGSDAYLISAQIPSVGAQLHGFLGFAAQDAAAGVFKEHRILYLGPRDAIAAFVLALAGGERCAGVVVPEGSGGSNDPATLRLFQQR